jgi:cell division protein FtsN
MDQRSERGLEFVLDNRKLIVGFFVLIAVCGAFFVIGFVEGKRQVVGLETRVIPATHPESQPTATTAAPVTTPAKGTEERSVRDQLDWYNRVNKSGEATKGLEPAPEPVKTVVQPATPPPSAHSAAAKDKAAAPKQAPAKPTYSVQVGAFRQRQEAEAKAASLKSKGYDYVIEPPVPPNSLFLLKIGKFPSRADAAAMQLRLKKDGVGSFIKTNP